MQFKNNVTFTASNVEVEIEEPVSELIVVSDLLWVGDNQRSCRDSQ